MGNHHYEIIQTKNPKGNFIHMVIHSAAGYGLQRAIFCSPCNDPIVSSACQQSCELLSLGLRLNGSINAKWQDLKKVIES